MIRHAELVSASVQTQRVAIVLAAGQKDQITAWKINRTLNRKIVSDKFLERSFFLFCCEQKRKNGTKKEKIRLSKQTLSIYLQNFLAALLHENFVRKCKESVTEVTTGGHPLLPPFGLRFIPSPLWSCRPYGNSLPAGSEDRFPPLPREKRG